MKRRQLARASAALAASHLLPGWAAAPVAATDNGGEKVLRYAFQVAETGFDPAQLSDLYSRIVTAHIFDAPLTYDHLARPFKLKPLVCTAMPEISDDYRSFVFRIRPGIHFADDPAFNGKRRELVAEDFVYAMKRIFDPKLKSPQQSTIASEGIVGLQELYDESVKSRKPFDYERRVEGLRATDRYTLQVRLRESRPRHLYTWAARDVLCAMAREVVEAYGDAIMEHPVGTGPFRLAEWRRSSRIVLTRNPNYRDDFYEAEPNDDDAEGKALVERFKGRKLPMLDRVEIAIIEQPQPRWLSFVTGEQDFMERLPNDFIDQAVPGGKIAPNLGKRGVRAYRNVSPESQMTIFNMENGLVGGYTPEKVALRRAMVLGNNIDREIRIVRHSQAIPAQSIIAPMSEGYRP
ncbi:MAG: ABC transporter substrate-binding protein, partial [Pseudomonadota bacterium]|nr:ABC transporter substrate-binding protein [Pseudomonadota bacterium]